MALFRSKIDLLSVAPKEHHNRFTAKLILFSCKIDAAPLQTRSCSAAKFNVSPQMLSCKVTNDRKRKYEGL
ncbi:MAG: hypothetical protein NVSMB49_07770 [Ktedonobacteraceae bacterium]